MALWVFFDLGGTLLDEEPFISLVFKEIYRMLVEHDIKVHMDDIYEKVEELVFTRRYGDHFFTDIIENLCFDLSQDKEITSSIISYYKSRVANQYLEKIHPHPGVEKILEKMSRRYKLGIIANQSSRVKEYLEDEWKLFPYFDLIVISENVGYRKPNLNIFLHALGEANSSPNTTFMIGDRLDHDIKPAKILGMETIRVKQGIFSVQEPITPTEIPDFEIFHLNDLLNFFK